jgi:hypothetical protein
MPVGTELGTQIRRNAKGCDLGKLRGWPLGNYEVAAPQNPEKTATVPGGEHEI